MTNHHIQKSSAGKKTTKKRHFHHFHQHITNVVDLLLYLPTHLVLVPFLYCSTDFLITAVITLSLQDKSSETRAGGVGVRVCHCVTTPIQSNQPSAAAATPLLVSSLEAKEQMLVIGVLE